MGALELSIDTSTRYASVSVSRAGETCAQLAWRSERNHSVELVPAVQAVLGRARATAAEVDAVFVATGPGGFSALRVGISFAKSLAAAGGLPLVGVPTLDVEAQPYLGIGHPVCAVIQAGRDKLYAGRYGLPDGDGGGSGVEYGVFRPADLIHSLPDGTLVCGEGAGLIEALAPEGAATSTRTVSAEPPTRSGSVLAGLAYRRLDAGDTDDPASLQPIYLHGSQLEAARRNVKPNVTEER